MKVTFNTTPPKRNIYVLYESQDYKRTFYPIKFFSNFRKVMLFLEEKNLKTNIDCILEKDNLPFGYIFLSEKEKFDGQKIRKNLNKIHYNFNGNSYIIKKEILE